MGSKNFPSHDFTNQRRLEENENDDPCAAVAVSDYGYGLHIASIFIIFFVSALGFAIPLVAKHSKKVNINPYWITLGKCAGIGVMLACGLIHMLLPSTESLTSACVSTAFSTTYPAFSYFFALMAALSVHLGEFLLTNSILQEGSDPEESLQNSDKGDNVDSSEAMVDEVDDESLKTSTDDAKFGEQDKAKKLQAKLFAEAVIIEYSLSVHSILIGIAAGVSDRSTLVELLVALVFHQMLEGVALGSRLSDSIFTFWAEVGFAAVFAVSAPLGLMIGIIVYKSFNVNDSTFLLVQGTIDGICGGILLYTGFLILFDDFPKDMAKYCQGEYRRLMQAGMFIVLWVSAIMMSLIGLWL